VQQAAAAAARNGKIDIGIRFGNEAYIEWIEMATRGWARRGGHLRSSPCDHHNVCTSLPVALCAGHDVSVFTWSGTQKTEWAAEPLLRLDVAADRYV